MRLPEAGSFQKRSTKTVWKESRGKSFTLYLILNYAMEKKRNEEKEKEIKIFFSIVRM